MSTLAVSEAHKPGTDKSTGTYPQPPTLVFTLSDSSSDPSSVCLSRSEFESACSSAGLEVTETDGSITEPRGHHLAWTIPSRLIQPPVTPTPLQISISLSTLTVTRSSRSNTSPSTLSYSPSIPVGLSSTDPRPGQQEAPNRSTAPCLRGRSPCATNNNDISLRNHIRAHTFDTSSTSSPSSPFPSTSRRSAFTTTAALFTSMSRPSWDPFPLISSTSQSHAYPSSTTSASVTPNISTAPNPIASNPNPISIEDARLLDPSYLSSIPLSSHTACQNHSSLSIGNHNSGHNAGATYNHAIPYIDPQGTLHDPDYRPFPIIRQTKHPSPSPFASRKSYWESEDDEFESDAGGHGGDGDDEDEGSAPSTPTSTTPFISYFLETHSLKRGPTLRNVKSSPNLFGSSPNYGLDGRGGGGRGKWGNKGSGAVCPGSSGGARAQLKLSTAHMYATIATGLGSRSQGYHGPSPTTPTRGNVAPSLPQYASSLSTSPPSVEDIYHPGKEKKGWGGLLWKSGRREGADRD